MNNMGLTLTKNQKKKLKVKTKLKKFNESTDESIIDATDAQKSIKITHNEKTIWSEIEKPSEMVIPVFTIHDTEEKEKFFIHLNEQVQANKNNNVDLDASTGPDVDTAKKLPGFIAQKAEIKYRLNKDIEELTNDIPRMAVNILLDIDDIIDPIFELYTQNNKLIDDTYKLILTDQSIKCKRFTGDEISELSIIHLKPMNKIAKLVKMVTSLYQTQMPLFDTTIDRSKSIYDQEALQIVRKNMFSIISKYNQSVKSIYKIQKKINDSYEDTRKYIQMIDSGKLGLVASSSIDDINELKELYNTNKLGYGAQVYYTDTLLRNVASSNKSYNKNEKDLLIKTKVSPYNFLDLLAKEYVLVKFCVTLVGMKNTVYAYSLELLNILRNLGSIPAAFRSIDPLNYIVDTSNENKLKLADRIISLPEGYHSLTAFIPETFTSEVFNSKPKVNNELSNTKKAAEQEETLAMIVNDLKNIPSDISQKLLIEPFISLGVNINDLLSKTPLPMKLLNTLQKDTVKSIEMHMDHALDAIDRITEKETRHKYITDVVTQLVFRQLIIANTLKTRQNISNKQIFKLMVDNDNLSKRNIELEAMAQSQTTVTEEEKNELTKQIQTLTHQLERKDAQLALADERTSVLNKEIAQFEATKEKVKSLEQEIAILTIKNNNLSNEIDTIINSDVEIEDEAGLYNPDDFINELREKNLVFIGGHEHWHANLKQTFPDAKIIASTDGSAPMNKVSTSDVVVINTAILNHPLYWRAKNAFTYNKNGTLVYLNTQSSNINKTIDSIHMALRKKDTDA